jgi:hypothetical protein
MYEAKSLSYSKSAKGNKARANEKKASAKLRSRKGFDDQSSVDKTYSWLQHVVAEIERPFNMSRDEYLKVKHGYKD